ncbi:MAG: FAD-dependent monooxygenase [Gammaproteobacteria bacterium]|nr:FAD-dependent monooxygenase [Gammaproteobacteria bacterium]
MNNPLPVLIVGAGPVGLLMACELARRGVSFRIIDAKPERTTASNATWIQTRTIEILDLMGIADRFLKVSHRCDAVNLYHRDTQLLTIPFDLSFLTHPYVLMLAQSETERLLIAYLKEFKCEVERPCKLIDVKQHDNQVTSTIELKNGETEIINSQFLVACDGANSKVREVCKIHFLGQDVAEQFMVADANINSSLPSNEIQMFFDQGTILPDKGQLLTAFPLGDKKYRITANLYQSHPRQFFSPQEVQEAVHERTYGNYTVNSVSWISPFWIHSKEIERFSQGSIFFAGDAAHTHSPAGGQGMNTGMQDAFNLAWKLALVINHKASPSLLESYHSERYPIVNEIVAETEKLTNMALFDKTFMTKLKSFSRKVSRSPVIMQKKLSMQISQLSTHYQNSPIIHYVKHTGLTSPQPGERAPDVIMNPPAHLYNFLRNTSHNALLFCGLLVDETKLKKILTLQQWLKENYPELIKVHVVSEKTVDVENNILDENKAIHQAYHIETPAVFIVRPDNYIAYCSNDVSTFSLGEFLKRYNLVGL